MSSSHANTIFLADAERCDRGRQRVDVYRGRAVRPRGGSLHPTARASAPGDYR